MAKRNAMKVMRLSFCERVVQKKLNFSHARFNSFYKQMFKMICKSPSKRFSRKIVLQAMLNLMLGGLSKTNMPQPPKPNQTSGQILAKHQTIFQLHEGPRGHPHIDPSFSDSTTSYKYSQKYPNTYYIRTYIRKIFAIDITFKHEHTFFLI